MWRGAFSQWGLLSDVFFIYRSMDLQLAARHMSGSLSNYFKTALKKKKKKFTFQLNSKDRRGAH